MHGMFLWVKFHRKTTKDLKSFVLQFLRWSTFTLLVFGRQLNHVSKLSKQQLVFIKNGSVVILGENNSCYMATLLSFSKRSHFGARQKGGG